MTFFLLSFSSLNTHSLNILRVVKYRLFALLSITRNSCSLINYVALCNYDIMLCYVKDHEKLVNLSIVGNLQINTDLIFY